MPFNLATFLIVVVLLVALLLASLLGAEQAPILAAICETLGCS
ncbi:hypothetical protein [Gottfriedia solisilvae]|uniref:Uncharacterized protein n=1 Tax=Gottfriedia solisilvae TaxID=1516104 RepID=A0A8J3ACX6_9BACI|nr:hypothetical protein [Gottfriedia solisilvae]GGI11643.1 hypothetical protein GCM10007380_08870 [Gottfriedia solisilvae]